MRYLAGVAILVFLFVVLCIRVIPAGYVGVYHIFGKVNPKAQEAGLRIKSPVTRITNMSIRLQSYTMSLIKDEGDIQRNDAIDALTSEGLTVILDLTGWYRLDAESAPKVYREIGTDYVAKIVRPTLRTAIREVLVNYTAQEIYSAKRDQITQEITDRTSEVVSAKGITFEKLLIRNVKLPKRLSDAIDAKLQMDQEAQQMKFVLEKERKEKERKMIEAEGIATANKIIAEGLTPEYLQWYRIQMMKTLASSPNSTFVFIPEDLKSAPPMILQSK